MTRKRLWWLLSLVTAGWPSKALAAEPGVTSSLVPADMAFVAIATMLVFFMTPALGIFYGGMVKRKNVLNTMMMSLVAISVVGLQWFLFGYSLSFTDSGSPYLGNLDWALFKGVGLTAEPGLSLVIPHMEFAVFMMMFAIVTAAIISGSIVERVGFGAYCIIIFLWTTIVYDPMCHMVWGQGGLLLGMGALDFAGGTAIHITSGVSALTATVMLGKRYWYGSGSTRPHNMPYVIFGASFLWMGWFAFNGGCALGANEIMVLALLNTAISSMAGALTWMIIDQMTHGKTTVFGFVTGALAGLVGITPGAGFVAPISAIPIGIITCVVCYLAITKLKEGLGYDDSLDPFGCHGVGGMVGCMLTGVFATTSVNPEGADGLLYGNPSLMVPQTVGLVIAIVMAVVGTALIIKLVGSVMSIRVSPEAEKGGLDINLHSETAYSKM